MQGAQATVRRQLQNRHVMLGPKQVPFIYNKRHGPVGLRDYLQLGADRCDMVGGKNRRQGNVERPLLKGCSCIDIF